MENEGGGKAGEIPCDVVWEVLTRLPATTLVRFRSVCKSWNALISSNSQFIKSHLHFSLKSSLNHNKVLVFKRPSTLYCSFNNYDYGVADCWKEVKLPSISNDENDLPRLQVFSSCHGLVLLRDLSWRQDPNDPVVQQRLILWNPVTNNYKSFFASCPNRSVAFAICYNALADEYKVILVFRSYTCYFSTVDHSGGSDVMVYDVNNQNWVTVSQPCYTILGTIKCHWLVLPANGMLHCVCFRMSDYTLVVYFDLLAGKFKEVPLPTECVGLPYLPYLPCHPYDEDTSIGLELWKGLLCVHRFTKSNQQLTIWVMREYGNKESWAQLVAIQIPSFSSCLRVLTFSAKDELLLELQNKKLVIYNPSNGLFSPLRHGFSSCSWTAINYVGSLIPP